MIETFSAILLIAGSIFTLIAAIGIIRFPDIYMRKSASAKASTFGVSLIALSVILINLNLIIAIKLLAILFLLFLTIPIGSQVLARAAIKMKVKFWDNTKINQLEDK
ncbi:MAG: monovalent cation/H(+) antiporter subunit G [Ignavibacteria bacterium]|nr:monovalent cation/H(+) antiporter subunit G [Ignavibacteria bacterium]